MRAFSAVPRLALPVAVTVVWLASCTAVEDNDTTNTLVIITAMEGAQGGTTSPTFVTDLISDVETCRTQNNVRTCSVFNDNGRVSMIARPKDQIRETALALNDIVFERYRVTYIRADGRNVPGVEVPYPFDGAANFRVPITGDEVQRPFLLVRHQAKLEPPLINLVGLGGAVGISVLAQVDFFGRDVAGRAITVRGFLNITFIDLGDES
jgi:hypothetical protein